MSKEKLHITQEELEKIEQFLSGELNGTALQHFEAELKADEGLQQKLQHVQELLTGIKEAALQDDMQRFHKNTTEQQDNKSKNAKVINIKKYAVAAAVAAIILLGGWLLFLQPDKNEKIFATYYQPDSGLFTAMSAGSEKYEFEKGMVYYKSGDHDKALQIWQALSKTNTSDTLSYFLGSAFLAANKAKESISHLQKVAANTASAFYKDANWYTGLALIKNNEDDKAIPFIERSNNENKEALLRSLNK